MVLKFLRVGGSRSPYLMVHALGCINFHRLRFLTRHDHVAAEKIYLRVGQNIRCLATCPTPIICPRFVLKVVCHDRHLAFTMRLHIWRLQKDRISLLHISSFIQQLGCDETHRSLFSGFFCSLTFPPGTIRDGFQRLSFANRWVKGLLTISNLFHLSVLLVNVVNHLLL